MAIKAFKRYEKKYLLNKNQYDMLTSKVLEYMDLDKHCKGGNNYNIYNIYYDTKNNDVIRHSISKPYYKEKLRLRSYVIPKNPEDIVFLELKKKINGIVSKRRVVLNFKEATDFLEYGIRPIKDDYISNQVLNEIEYYLSQNEVYETVYISYSRKALFAKDDPDFRLTFDSKILTRRTDLTLDYGDFGTELLENEQYLMEVKILGAIPVWFTKILSELSIYNTHFSKYGNEFMRFCKTNKQNNKINITNDLRREKLC